MKHWIGLVVFCSVMCTADAQTKPGLLERYTPSRENLAQRAIFQDMKFGLFIHWGLYSILGNGEWVMHQQKIPYNSYKKLADFFYPQAYDAKEWVRIAKNAGMKYITVTTRHHDGFTMYQTKASSYNIVDATPYGKDPIKGLARECAKEGIKLNFYYSLLDWGRADYGFGKKIVNGAPDSTDWKGYINFMKAQLTELVTSYPNIGCIWFDGDWERVNADWKYNEIYALIHRLNPGILIGNNHHLAPLPGEDFQMYEKDLPGENKAGFSGTSQVGALPLETSETMNNSWGFNIKDTKYKSVRTLIQYLVNAAGRNSNFLLNVGPMPNGKIQPEFIDTLAAVGKWMEKYGHSIYGTRGNSIQPQKWGVVTKKGNILYLHILNNIDDGEILLTGMKEKIQSVQLLNGGKALPFKQVPGAVSISTRDIVLDPTDTIIQVEIQ